MHLSPNKNVWLKKNILLSYLLVIVTINIEKNKLEFEKR